MEDTVTLVIPCAPEYVGVARMTILGVASRLGFSYDAVEDIRLAVAEACTSSITRARAILAPTEPLRITLSAQGDAESLTVVVEDNVPTVPARSPEPLDDDLNNVELGSLLMELFVDEVTQEPHDAGTRIRLLKRNSNG